jgi:hypothetical protein
MSLYLAMIILVSFKRLRFVTKAITKEYSLGTICHPISPLGKNHINQHKLLINSPDKALKITSQII